MARKERLRPNNVDPFREALAPPLVILFNGMELRQVEGNAPDYRCFRIVNQIGSDGAVMRDLRAHCISAFTTCCAPNSVGHRLEPIRSRRVL